MSDYQAPEVKAELAAEAAAKAGEIVEETIDGVVEVVEVVRNNPAALAVVGFAALSIGAVGGYFFANKRLKAMYEEMVDEQIAEAKQYYSDLYKVNEDGTRKSPMDVLKERSPEAAAALAEYQGEEFIPADRPMTAEEIDEEDRLLAGAEVRAMQNGRKVEERTKRVEETTTVSVFDQSDETFDYEAEVKKRSEDAPYIITHDEFFEGHKDYENSSYTWFEVDNVLVNEREEPIADPDTVVGDDHLSRFGSGSKDKNIVYVRNDKLQMDFEITRSPGSYLEEVLGVDKDEAGGTLRHSNRNAQLSRRREFRHGDG